MQTHLAPRLLAVALATGQLSPRQLSLVGGMLAELERLDARKAALSEILDALDPNGCMTLWALALRLERLLARFRHTRRGLIEAGRQPTEFERLLYVMTGPKPAPGKKEPEVTCARWLWEEIKEVRG